MQQVPFKTPSPTTKLVKLCCGSLLSLCSAFPFFSTSFYLILRKVEEENREEIKELSRERERKIGGGGMGERRHSV